MCVPVDGTDMPCRWCRDKRLLCKMSSKQKPGPKAAANASEAGVGTDAAGRTGAVETAQPQEEASTGWAWSTTNAVRRPFSQQVAEFSIHLGSEANHWA